MKVRCLHFAGTDAAMMQKAVDLINIIVTDYEQGQIYTGKVISIKEFGAFLEFAPGKKVWYTSPRSQKSVSTM